MHVPYIVPSENGGRADTRWVAVREAEGGYGLAVMPCDGTPPMQVGVVPGLRSEIWYALEGEP